MTVPAFIPEPGQPGTPGEPGNPTGTGGKGGRGGRGGRGAVGPVGETAWSDKAMMFLVAVLTLVFAFLFIRLAINQNEIAQERYESCMRGVAVIEQYNEQQQEIAAILRRNPDIPGSSDFARVYESAALRVPDCEPNPADG